MTEETALTPEERKLWDAKADVEAWDFARSIMAPWFEAARRLGHPELTEAMRAGIDYADERYADASEKLGLLEKGS